MNTNPPSDFDPDSFFSGTHWHQKWEIFPNVFTPGINDVAALLDKVAFPDSLEGKRVLDIGFWNGCFCFEAERRGAKEVIGIGPEAPEATGAMKLRDILGSQVTEFRLGTIYDLNPDEIGSFDVVMCFGVLYHLRHPILGLDNLYKVCQGTLYLETEITKDFSDASATKFHRRNELNDDDSNWFVPNKQCLKNFLLSSGFRVFHYNDELKTRASIASLVEDKPEWLLNKTSEGIYYDLISKPVLGPRKYFEKRGIKKSD
jgi:tRNA (mo5U34)-methyltransferase